MNAASVVRQLAAACRWLLLGGLLCFALLSTAQEEVEGAAGMAERPEDAALVRAPIPDDLEPRQRCLRLHQRAAALGRLGRPADANKDYRQALALHDPAWAGDAGWCDRWRLQSGLVRSLKQVGDTAARAAFIEEIGPEWRHANPRRYFLSRLWLIEDYVNLGQLRRAESVLKRAGELLPELRQQRDWRSESSNILNQWTLYQAYYQMLNGNFVEAERLRRESLHHARDYEAQVMRSARGGEQLQRIAQGSVTSALRLLSNSLSAQGKFAEAELHARDALRRQLAYQSESSPDVARQRAGLARIKLEQGDLAAAEALGRQALQALERGQVKANSPLLADVRAELAFILQVQGNWPASLALFEAREQGLRSDPEQARRSGVLRTDWAYALLRNGKIDAAVDMMQRIDGHYRRVPFADPQLVARAKGYLATALAARGDDTQALALFREAIPQLQQGFDGDADGEGLGLGRQFRVNAILEGYLGLLARLAAREGRVGELAAWEEAFRVADIARGSSVQRAILASSARAVLGDAELTDLARREQDAAQRRSALVRLLARLASGGESGQIVSDLQRDIARLAEEQQQLRQVLARRFPDYLNLIAPNPPLPGELQAMLQAGEAAVVFYVGDERSHVWTLTREHSSFRTLPVTAAKLQAAVTHLRQGLDLADGRLRPFDAGAAHALYRSLLADDASLWKQATLLNVVPHQALGQIPFGLLIEAAPGDSRELARHAWLIQRLAIAQQPSTSAFVSLRRAASGKSAREAFIGFGDPMFADRPAAQPGSVRNLRLLGLGANDDPFLRLAPLPDTEQELNEIARTLGADPARHLYLGKQASEGNAKKTPLADFRVVAFATHGLVPGELSGLEQPALALANPRLVGDAGNDGWLTLEEVLGLKLNADWVVLSACNTGAADSRQGEALSGLGRGFFFAGARSLLVSHWAVDTVSARMLTTGLFRHQAAGAPNRAEALRRAMLEVQRTSGGAYAHPAFWAPFALVGDGYR